MRVATIANSFKEGVLNIVRHPLVTLASVTTIALMLTLIGAFAVFSENVRTIVEQAGREPPVTAWAEYGIDAGKVETIRLQLVSCNVVEECVVVTPEQAFEAFKASMGDKSSALAGVDASILSYQFNIRLNDPAMWEEFSAQARGIPGIRKVEISQVVMDFLGNARTWVNVGSLAAFVVLCAISLFIISNMVRISVYARGEEISIMKYVGATNAYIRFPYILEGALVGLFGALLAWTAVYAGYVRIYGLLMKGTDPDSFLAMVPVAGMAFRILWIDMAMGVLVGAVGSALSVRRHIRV
ncbi:MAG: ABC transporter permease [Clostridia bacterium]|nr:ABC transporter permease [Clostridia bacterium]